MEFKKISAPSLQELFIQQMEHMILSGELQPGDKLPPERQLAEAMQISRSVVNSGLSALERKGFLTIKPRAGVFVADYRRHGNIETLLSIMTYNGGMLKKEEIRSILETRIALESLAVQLCVPRITDEEIELLREKTANIAKVASPAETAEAAFEFQHELAIMSGNTLIPLIFQSFRPAVLTLWMRFCSLYGADAIYKNTFILWSYLKRRDAAGAVKWIEDSLNESIQGKREIYY